MSDRKGLLVSGPATLLGFHQMMADVLSVDLYPYFWHIVLRSSLMEKDMAILAMFDVEGATGAKYDEVIRRVFNSEGVSE